MNINRAGVEFIVEEETGGKSYYEKVYKSTFCWPGGASGPTAMVGIDIGYYTTAEVDNIFKPLTSSDELELIQGGRGKKGTIAQAYTKKLKHITFTWDEAIQTFEHHTLPKFTSLAERVFPGINSLCENTQTAILSLVFNRGAATKGPSRREMAAIKGLIKSQDYKEIARQIRGMKRLWDKTSGLVGRREREAKLVESCV